MPDIVDREKHARNTLWTARIMAMYHATCVVYGPCLSAAVTGPCLGQVWPVAARFGVLLSLVLVSSHMGFALRG